MLQRTYFMIQKFKQAMKIVNTLEVDTLPNKLKDFEQSVGNGFS